MSLNLRLPDHSYKMILFVRLSFEAQLSHGLQIWQHFLTLHVSDQHTVNAEVVQLGFWLVRLQLHPVLEEVHKLLESQVHLTVLVDQVRVHDIWCSIDAKVNAQILFGVLKEDNISVSLLAELVPSWLSLIFFQSAVNVFDHFDDVE